MYSKTPLPIDQKLTNYFNEELIRVFNKVSLFKIKNVSSEQSNEQVWETLPIASKIKYITYLAYQNRESSKEEENIILNQLFVDKINNDALSYFDGFVFKNSLGKNFDDLHKNYTRLLFFNRH
ncbi:hypothetical protein SK355_12225 (plasmid) [Candidatus Fukatsuia symbiotica]|uniref:Uncharacterized protein n=1 Tax=Candidatus Fukatsuia symbiotica TaxID=1878942 RepID=A0A2U8I8M6_9GAMM|nr:hypothetical protein [Candidatus Fukatsuia symbiotica]AWK15546.1 hypothetical protein CCS41_14070 [Candidatus Fukatsuia symbiotica]MEA9445936.1 hypothetical protein [Candidatus Fukatsuia symbiotica]